MRRRAAVALALLLLAAPVVPLAAGAGTGAAAPAAQDDPVLAQDQPEADNTVTRIALAPDGTATWTIRFRTRLDSDADEAEYRRFQERFRNNTSRYLDPFRDRMTGVVADADGASDRDMAATDFDAETSIQEVPRRWGVVRFEFTWIGFAAVDGDRVVVGDVFAGGFYIGEGDALEVAVPEDYVITAADPAPDERGDGVATWVGREDFADGQPRLVAEPSSEATPGGATDGDAADEGLGVVPEGLAAALALVVGVGVAWQRGHLAHARERFDELLAEGLGPGGDGGTDAGAAAAGGDDAAPRGDLLADEDRVLAVLRERGGRVKQAAVADELGWSDSKTSRVLSRMDDEGAIRKFRLGRENVIELPDAAEE